MSLNAIILAAGEGTRMRSRHAKVTHMLLDRPLISWSVRAARLAGAKRIVVVVGHAGDEVRAALQNEPDIEFVEQKERKGTGHAAKIALEATGIKEGALLLLAGDEPLLKAETLRMLAECIEQDKQVASVLTMKPPHPAGYGRVQSDELGQVQAIIEDKDCTDAQRDELTECNSSIYAFDAAVLRAHIDELDSNNAQHEYYLTDMIEIFRRYNLPVCALRCADYVEALGVNNRKQLSEAAAIMQKRINEQLMAEGVSMLAPDLVWIGPDATIGKDTLILPLTIINGATRIGSDCTIGPNSRLTDTLVGDNCTVDETVAIKATLENNVSCGPRAYLRPGAHLLDGAKAGTHVEIKNSTIGQGSKVPHLSYIGDTEMGSGVNIGAGSITCNYDGVHKNKTVIGDDVFIGSDTMMVAPVAIGKGALVGASSCITKDVPADALTFERSEQTIVKGYASRRLARLKKGE